MSAPREPHGQVCQGQGDAAHAHSQQSPSSGPGDACHRLEGRQAGDVRHTGGHKVHQAHTCDGHNVVPGGGSQRHRGTTLPLLNAKLTSDINLARCVFKTGTHCKGFQLGDSIHGAHNIVSTKRDDKREGHTNAHAKGRQTSRGYGACTWPQHCEDTYMAAMVRKPRMRRTGSCRRDGLRISAAARPTTRQRRKPPNLQFHNTGTRKHSAGLPVHDASPFPTSGRPTP
jgi:hypothetical protein